ncbi:MAG: EamA family transporter [Planctomycetota bacterium]
MTPKRHILSSKHLPWLGTLCCLLSAVGYTCANICRRQLAGMEADTAWVIWLQETTAVVLLGPWFLWRISHGHGLTCGRRSLLILILAALAVQLVGNLGIQWSFGIVGLVVSLPMVFSAMLIGGTVLGVAVFAESLRARSLVATALVIVSIGLLSWGGAKESQPLTASVGLLISLLAIAAAAVGGITFATLGAALRHAAHAGVPVPITVIVVTGTGTISLGLLCLIRLGPAEMLRPESSVWTWGVAAGLCNVAAFAFITKGMKLTTLVHANVLNASQVAMGALAGVIVFRESWNPWLLAGIVLTITGIMLFGQPRKAVVPDQLLGAESNA